jgi:hypothetical protein
VDAAEISDIELHHHWVELMLADQQGQSIAKSRTYAVAIFGGLRSMLRRLVRARLSKRGSGPDFLDRAQTAATRMADAAGYQAIVLDHASLPVNPPPVERVFPTSSMLRSVAATALALALAALSLSKYWRREYFVFKPVRAVMSGLQQLHSGHVGDYVALLTLGVAAFGIVLPVLMKFGL